MVIVYRGDRRRRRADHSGTRGCCNVAALSPRGNGATHQAAPPAAGNRWCAVWQAENPRL